MKKTFLFLSLVISPLNLFAQNDGTAATNAAATAAADLHAKVVVQPTGNTQQNADANPSQTPSAQTSQENSSFTYKPATSDVPADNAVKNNQNSKSVAAGMRLATLAGYHLSHRDEFAGSWFNDMLAPLFGLMSDIGKVAGVKLNEGEMMEHGSTLARCAPLLGLALGVVGLLVYGKADSAEPSTTSK